MEIERSVQTGFDKFFGFLPNLLGFLLLLIIGFVVAKLVAAAVRKGLEMAGVDRHLQESNAHSYVERVLPGAKVSGAVAKVVFWFIFLFFAVAAVSALRIPALTQFMNQVLAYLPNIIVAIAIFVVAALISGAVAAGIGRIMGDTPTGKIAATVLPAVVMVVALFMILEQLQIAPEIVRIAFAATMGALALGLALAFGLGGRSVAQRMLEEAYLKGREHKDQVKSDIQTGKARAQAEAHEAQSYGDQAATETVQYTSGDAATGTAQTQIPGYSGATSAGQPPHQTPPTGYSEGDGRHQR
jgi:hypothetical protein